MRRNKIWMTVLAVCWAGTAFAGQITLETYFPAPQAAFNRLRLVPTNLAGVTCDGNYSGLLVYDVATDALRVCSSAAWSTFSGFWTQDGDNIYPTDYANPNLKVGIGTSTPQAHLDVETLVPPLITGIRLTETQGTATNWEVQAHEVSGAMDKKGFSLWGGQSGSEDYTFNINRHGDVGFGELEPDTLLHLYHVDGAEDSSFRLFPRAGQAWDLLLNGGADEEIGFFNAGGDGNITVFKTPVKQLMSIKNAGQVTIGETDPRGDSDMTVSSTDGITRLRIEETTGTNAVWETRVHSPGFPAGFGHDFSIWGGLAGSEDYRMIVRENGHVAFGTTDTAAMFTIGGGGDLRLQGNDGSAHMRLYDTDPGFTVLTSISTHGNGLQIRIDDTSGTTPYVPLPWYDKVAYFYALGHTHNFELFGNRALKTIGGDRWAIPSDIRWKKNIRPLSEAYKKVMALEGVVFEWKESLEKNLPTEPRMGFIAQDAEKVIPSWVSEDEDEYKILTPKGFTALTVETVRSLKERVDQVKQINEKLRQRIEALEK